MANQATPKRLYFDTNILWGWPHCSNEIWNLFSFAKWLKIELFIPKVVEDELEAQFIRGVWNIIDTVKLNLKQLDALCRGIVDNDITGNFYSESDLRKAFRHASNHIKQQYDISIVPLTKMPVADLLDMAINRIAPFEQVSIDKKTKTGVVGFQDAAILLSIMEHLPKTPDRFVFITADTIFHHSDTQELLNASGIRLERCKSANGIWNELFDHVYESVRRSWTAEMAAIETSLNADKDRLATQIADALETSQHSHNLWTRAKAKGAIRIEKFDFVKIDMPAKVPPRVETYHRPDENNVPISVRATAEMDTLVEPSFLDFGWSPETTSLQNATLTESLNVSLSTSVRDGVFSNFNVTGVEKYKY
jgi:hypothetical protein